MHVSILVPQTIDQADLRLRGEASCRYPGKVKRRIGRGQLDDDQRGVAKAGAELGDDVDPRGVLPTVWTLLQGNGTYSLSPVQSGPIGRRAASRLMGPGRQRLTRGGAGSVDQPAKGGGRMPGPEGRGRCEPLQGVVLRRAATGPRRIGQRQAGWRHAAGRARSRPARLPFRYPARFQSGERSFKLASSLLVLLTYHNGLNFRLRCFKSSGSAQRFLSAHAAVFNTFNVQRHLTSASTHRTFRAAAMSTWREAVTAA